MISIKYNHYFFNPISRSPPAATAADMMSDAPSRHSPRRELHLHGPRPPPLRFSKESRKIRKHKFAPPPATAEAKSRHHPPPPPPVIIYTVSPKVIQVEPNEFMSVVQRLTGSNSSSSSSSTLNTSPPPPSSANGGGVPPEWGETQLFDGGVEMPQNLPWNANDSNPLSYLPHFNTALHGKRNLNNFMENNMLMNRPSSSSLDVFNYLYDI